jgi:hypothetical protein
MLAQINIVITSKILYTEGLSKAKKRFWIIRLKHIFFFFQIIIDFLEGSMDRLGCPSENSSMKCRGVHSIGEGYWQGTMKVNGEIYFAFSVCAAHMPHGIARHRTQVSSVIGRGLTTSITACPLNNKVQHRILLNIQFIPHTAPSISCKNHSKYKHTQWHRMYIILLNLVIQIVTTWLCRAKWKTKLHFIYCSDACFITCHTDCSIRSQQRT